MKRYADPSRPAAATVKQAVAEVEECDPTHLGTLSAAVDTDELNGVVAMPSSREGPQDSIQFRYCGYSITAFSDHWIHIES